MRFFLFGVAVCSLLALHSCTPSASSEFVAEQNFSLEGPLFEGPNSGQASISETFSRWLEEQGLTRDDIVSVQLKEVILVNTSNPAEGLISDAGLTFAGGDLEMTQVAVLNPVPSSAAGAKLTTGTEANITPFLKLNEFIVLLDLGLANDLDDNLEATVKMKFEVTYKAKES